MSIERQHQYFVEAWQEDHDGRHPPFEWQICSTCRGSGTSTAYLGAYTQADREEMGDEWYDFVEDLRDGVYDRPCDTCGGSGKVQEFVGEAAEQWAEWYSDYWSDLAVRRAESGYYG